MGQVDKDFERLFGLTLTYLLTENLTTAKMFLQEHRELLVPHVPYGISRIKLDDDTPHTIRLRMERKMFLADCIQRGLAVAWLDWKYKPYKRWDTFPKEVSFQIRHALITGQIGALAQFMTIYPDLEDMINEFVFYARDHKEYYAEEFERVMRYLVTNRARLLPSRRIKLAKLALVMLEKEDDPSVWGHLQEWIGRSFLESPSGNLFADAEAGIVALNRSLEVVDSNGASLVKAEREAYLGMAYLDQINGKKTDNIEKGIALVESSLTVITRKKDPLFWAWLKASIGSRYAHRLLGSKSDNIEKAISCSKDALTVFTLQETPVGWALAKFALGSAYTFRQEGEPEKNEAEALEALNSSLLVYNKEEYPVEWAGVQHNIGTTYAESAWGARPEKQELAIEAFEKALTVLTMDGTPDDWAETQVNLATVYQERLLGDRKANSLKSFKCYQEALKVYKQERYTHELTTMFYNFAILAQQTGKYEEAIDHLRRALLRVKREEDPEQWAEIMFELGMAYRDRDVGEDYYKQIVSLVNAIDYFDQSLEERDETSRPLERAFSLLGAGKAYLEAAALDHVEEMALVRPKFEAFGKQALLDCLKIFRPNLFPKHHRLAQTDLGNLYLQQGDWKGALACFESALLANEYQFEAGYSPATRHMALQADPSLVGLTAYCWAKIGKPKEALAVLEKNKARYLADLLLRNEAELSHVAPELRTSFRTVCANLDSLESKTRSTRKVNKSFTQLSKALEEQRLKLAEVIKKIRETEPNFMQEGLSSDGVQALVDEQGIPVVYLFTTEIETAALFVLPFQEVKDVWLPQFTEKDVRRLLFGLGKENGFLESVVNGDRCTIQRFMDNMWEKVPAAVIQPIEKELIRAGFGQAILIVDGLLSLLPLNAMSSTVAFSQAPSAFALKTCIENKERRKKKSLLEENMCCLANPETTLAPLVYAGLEATVIASLFAETTTTIIKGKVSLRMLQEGTKGKSHLHFACHGTFREEDPLESALHLSTQEQLTLHAILDGSLSLETVRLCFLSACQTGMIDVVKIPNESVGFPSGFIASGIPGVIGSLWPVNDLSTALYTIKFYEIYREHHLQSNHPLPIAIVVKKTQEWLKNCTNDELAALFYTYKQHQNPEIAEPAQRQFEKFIFGDPSEKPFAHPYYWAAFSFYGQ